MLKLWIKTLSEDRIKSQLVYKTFQPYARDTFFDVLKDICEKLNIPTPILTSIHFDNLEKFHSMQFMLRDFVETIDFDKMIIEDCSN